MEHTNKIAVGILREEYADYDRNSWHYDREYKMLVRALCADVKKRFVVTYRYINRTDAALHADEVEAHDCEDAMNKVCANHNYEVEWSTIREIV